MRFCGVVMIILLLVCILPKASAEGKVIEPVDLYDTERLWDALEPDTKALLRGVEPIKQNKISDMLFSILYNKKAV